MSNISLVLGQRQAIAYRLLPMYLADHGECATVTPTKTSTTLPAITLDQLPNLLCTFD